MSAPCWSLPGENQEVNYAVSITDGGSACPWGPCRLQPVSLTEFFSILAHWASVVQQAGLSETTGRLNNANGRPMTRISATRHRRRPGRTAAMQPVLLLSSRWQASIATLPTPQIFSSHARRVCGTVDPSPSDPTHHKTCALPAPALALQAAAFVTHLRATTTSPAHRNNGKQRVPPRISSYQSPAGGLTNSRARGGTDDACSRSSR